MRFCHDIRSSGHLGIKKTIGRVRQRFQDDVRRYVNGCEQCLVLKNPLRKKQAPMQIVHTGISVERIAADIMGELPETGNDNKYILVVSDYFTKWTESFTMPNMESRTVAKIIVDDVIVRFGVPCFIHSDQGRQFESNLFKEMCVLLGIEKTRTSPYHPKSDGMVERFNTTLDAMLNAYIM